MRNCKWLAAMSILMIAGACNNDTSGLDSAIEFSARTTPIDTGMRVSLTARNTAASEQLLMWSPCGTYPITLRVYSVGSEGRQLVVDTEKQQPPVCGANAEERMLQPGESFVIVRDIVVPDIAASQNRAVEVRVVTRFTHMDRIELIPEAG